MGRRLSEDLVTAMYRDYLLLRSVEAVAVKYGRTPQSMWELFARRGLKMPRKHKAERVQYKGVVYTPDRTGYLAATTGKRERLNRVIWEEANGPVPQGYEICFKDGNKRNCRIENLALQRKCATGIQARWSSWKNKRGQRSNLPFRPRSNRFDAGIERLWKVAQPGEVFTCERIAEECGVTPQSIRQRELKILEKVRRRFGAELQDYLS